MLEVGDAGLEGRLHLGVAVAVGLRRGQLGLALLAQGLDAAVALLDLILLGAQGLLGVVTGLHDLPIVLGHLGEQDPLLVGGVVVAGGDDVGDGLGTGVHVRRHGPLGGPQALHLGGVLGVADLDLQADELVLHLGDLAPGGLGGLLVGGDHALEREASALSWTSDALRRSSWAATSPWRRWFCWRDASGSAV